MNRMLFHHDAHPRRRAVRHRALRLTPLLAAVCLSLAACGASDDGGAATTADADTPGAENEVASLGTMAPASDDSSADSSDERSGEPTEADMQQAALDYARCMREHGIEMDDPQFDSEGGGVAIALGGPGDKIDPEQMEAAQTACEPIMEEIRSSFEPPDPEELEKMKQEALEFSQCMREHGIDMPDPQFGENGQMTIAVGGPPGESDSSDAPPPIDADKFNEASEECGGPGGGMVRMSAPGGESGAGDSAGSVQIDNEEQGG